MGLYLGNRARLPIEYQEVEYIESSGTQYFNVGTTFNTNYKVVIDFQMLNSSTDQIPVGVKEISGGYTYKYGINVYNNLFYISAGSSDWTTFSADTNRHTITINKTSVTIDSTSGTINHQNFTYSLGLGVFRYNGNDPIYSSNKLYKLEIYDENGDKIYDLVPCYRVLDNVIGMYDLVNNVFYTNAGSGTFIKGPNASFYKGFKEIAIGKQGLPAEYQEVEWIGGTNNALNVEQVYIDTGITTSNNIGAWTEMLHTATRNDVEWFTNTLPNNTVRRGLTTYPSGKWCPQWETWRQTDIAYNTNQFYDIKLNWNNNKKCDIDGTTIYNCTNATFSSNNTIRIGNISYNGYGWKCKYFKISDGTTLVRDLVPCYRKSDDVIGMYDLVNGQFYTNSGSGTFTKGSDVPSSIRALDFKKIYVGSQKIRPAGYTPSTNTLAYYPLEIDTKDYSGNNRDGTNNGVTFSNGLGVFNGSSYVSLGTGSWTNIQTNMTINVWFKWNGSGSKDNAVVTKSKYYMYDRSDGYYGITVHESDNYLCGGYYTGSDYNIHPMNFRNTGGGSPTTGPVVQANKWYNVVITNDGTTKKAYIDGVLYATETANSTNTTTSIETRIGSFTRYNNDSFFNGNISAVIFEDKTRTEQEITDYYNLTKGNYGL